jgi:hypothetical protein
MFDLRLLAAILCAALVFGCGGPMARCRTDPRRYAEDIVPACEDCDGGHLVCVARSEEEIAAYDREERACAAIAGARWIGSSMECRHPQ